ncbi:MAG: DMT family transporter, partial [Patescibacteria group bacterium]|nr:DMT family transporter [Patescibacteria group bacterium]
MSWQFFAALNIVFFSLSTLMQRVLIKEGKSRPITYTIFFNLFTGIVLLLIGLFTHVLVFPVLTIQLVFFLLLAIFLYAFGNLFTFKALKQTEASKFTLIFATRVVFTILVAILFLSESFGIKEVIGTIFVFTGIVLVSHTSKKFHFNKGDLYGIIAAMCIGFANANARFLLHSLSIFPYMLIVFFGPVVVLSLIYPQEAKQGNLFLKKKALSGMALLGIIYAIANIGFFQAIKTGPSVSLVSVVILTSVIVTVILSILFLKERDNMWKKLLGALIS